MRAGRVALIHVEEPGFGRIGSGRQHVLQLHPLRGKCVEKSLDFRVGKQACDRLVEDFCAGQFTAFREAEEFRIRTAAPQEKRQPGGKFVRFVRRVLRCELV